MVTDDDNETTWTELAPRPEALPPDKRWHVFLSYRSVNRSWVLNLYDVLVEHGHTVFLDQVALPVGAALIDSLEQGLAGSQAGVLVWSTAAQDSDWVKREYQAMERMADGSAGSFQFVPIRLDNQQLPLMAQSRVFLDFAAYPDGPNGGELLRLLHAVVGAPMSDRAVRFAAEQNEQSQLAIIAIDAAHDIGDADGLVTLFEEGGLAWHTSAALGARVADALIKLDRRELAIGVLEALTERFERAIRPRQLLALALARRGDDGDLAEAQRILAGLYAAGARDPETLGILARTWMDRHEASGDPLHLRKSRDLYVEAFDGASDDYYTGINAAAKSVLLGELDVAAAYAAKVQEIVGTEPTGDYWGTATVGEVFLIGGQYEDAARLYLSAVALKPEDHGSHGSTWAQARRLMAKLDPTDEQRELIRSAFAHVDDAG